MLQWIVLIILTECPCRPPPKRPRLGTLADMILLIAAKSVLDATKGSTRILSFFFCVVAQPVNWLLPAALAVDCGLFGFSW